MTWYFFGEAMWQTLSLLGISAFLVFHFIHYISRQKYPMYKMLWALVLLLVGIIFLVKTKQVVAPYKVEGAIDIILGTAMAMIAFDFLVLFGRACGMHISASFESVCFWIIGLVYLGAGLMLLTMGSQEHFIRYDQVTDMLLQPFWILVLIRVIFLTRWSEKDIDTV